MTARPLPIPVWPFSGTVDVAADRRERLRRAEAVAVNHHFPAEEVEVMEGIDSVRAAAAACCGWKLIVARCAPAGGRRPA
jgi:hypothetical protein